MQVVLLLQAGDGPILLTSLDQKAQKRRIKVVQEHNHEPIRVAELLDGDERLEHELHVTFAQAGLHRRGNWYEAGALALVPEGTPRVKRDEVSDERRLAAQRLADHASGRA